MRWDGTERNYAADILKGIGIVFVVITHFSWSSTERRIYLFPFWIDMAVPVFMIISGFAHSASFEKRHIEKIRLAYAGGDLAFVRPVHDAVCGCISGRSCFSVVKTGIAGGGVRIWLADTMDLWGIWSGKLLLSGDSAVYFFISDYLFYDS